jgi:hypothetical protein
MAKKKKSKKKSKSKSISQLLAEQLQKDEDQEISFDAAKAGLTKEDFEDAFSKSRAIQKKGADPRKVVELPGVFQRAFLIMAEAEEEDDQINDISAMTSDKETKKEAKRILLRMRSRGMDVEITEDSAPSILERRTTVEMPDLPCILSPMNSMGNRMLLIARYVQGGVGVYQAEISDQKGLIEFSGGVIGRNRYRDIFKSMLESDESPMLEIPYAEARLWISTAASMNRKASQPLPDTYLEASSSLPEVSSDTGLPDGRQLYPSDSLKIDELLEESKNLHELPEFIDWVPDENMAAEIHEKFKEVDSSKVAINAKQKAEQIDKALTQAVENLFSDDDQLIARQNRLFDMAAYLHRTNQPDKAKQAAAAAWQLSAEDFKPIDSPFYSRLIRKMFREPEEIVKLMESADSDTEENAADKKTENLIVP